METLDGAAGQSYSETATLRRAGGRARDGAFHTHSLSCTKAGISKVGARGLLLLWLPPAPWGAVSQETLSGRWGGPCSGSSRTVYHRLQKQVCGLLRAKQGTQQRGSRTQPASPPGVTPRKKATRVPVTLPATLGGAKVPAFCKCHLWPGPNPRTDDPPN